MNTALLITAGLIAATAFAGFMYAAFVIRYQTWWRCGHCGIFFNGIGETKYFSGGQDFYSGICPDCRKK